MRSDSTNGRAAFGVAALGLVLVGLAGGADGRHPAVVWVEEQSTRLANEGMAIYRRTPADVRVTWGGLAACALLGLGVALERMVRLQRLRVIPGGYTGRFHGRLVGGKLDRAKALDFCELNPSPMARVVLAAVRRWGRPVAELERGVAMAKGVEVDRLRRNLGTLRRVAALAPLIGLLGTLMAANRGLSVSGAAWAPVVAGSLATLTVGVSLAILCLVVYDGLSGRVETLAGTLDRLGAEAVDAIASAAAASKARDRHLKNSAKIRRESANRPASPHSRRAEVPLEGVD